MWIIKENFENLLLGVHALPIAQILFNVLAIVKKSKEMNHNTRYACAGPSTPLFCVVVDDIIGA